mgnify:CR=1 FL=1
MRQLLGDTETVDIKMKANVVLTNLFDVFKYYKLFMKSFTVS